MSLLFTDTSALIKRYIHETGSAFIQSALNDPHHIVTISEITSLEFYSTLTRLNRTGILTAVSSAVLETAFEVHEQSHYLTVGIDMSIMVRARQFVKAGELRPADAIQLATALHVGNLFSETVFFLCADTDLITIAQQVGLTPVNPSSASAHIPYT